MATILSIQSWVAYGHVGNAAAVFPLERLGHEVWPIHTVQFSNHPGYGGFKGKIFDAAHVAELVAGLAERGLFARCDAVLSGYLGEAGTGDAVLDAVARMRTANPKGLFCCDPVMGDDKSGFFVRPGIPDFFRTRAIPAADIVTPNRFELEYLTDTRIGSLADSVRAARLVQARGPAIVAVTGLTAPVVDPGHIGVLAVVSDAAWLVVTPELGFDPAPNGTGDLFAALFLGHLLAGQEPEGALGRAVSALFAALESAAAQGLREMPLTRIQDRLVRPDRLFEVQTVPI